MIGGAQGNILVPIAMLGWIPFVVFLFRKFEARLAVAIAFVSAWMFLPVATFNLPGLPDYTKTSASCVGILVGAWFFDKERFSTFTFQQYDLPMLLWCTSPFFSSVFNGLGIYDGIAASLAQSITWGLPYYIARIYYCDAASLRLLAMAIFIGCIVYIPFCLFEMIMSPQLHRLTYGYHQHDFLQTLRDGGGYRPMVYMEHGLMTSMWMVLGVFIGTWLYIIGELPKKILKVPTVYLLAMLMITTIMMKSMGALNLLLIGLIAMAAATRFKTGIPILILISIPTLYAFTRSTGIWDGRNLSRFVAEKFSPTRAESLQFRFDNEKILIEKALQGTFFGWGGYGRSRVYDEEGKDISVTDGLWIIILGTSGIYGLTVLTIAVQLPVLLLIMRIKPERWKQGSMAAPAVMAVFLCLYMIDNLLNAMVNPTYMLFCGGLTSLLIKQPAYANDSLEEKNSTFDVPRHSDLLPATRFITAANETSSRFLH